MEKERKSYEQLRKEKDARDSRRERDTMPQLLDAFNMWWAVDVAAMEISEKIEREYCEKGTASRSALSDRAIITALERCIKREHPERGNVVQRVYSDETHKRGSLEGIKRNIQKHFRDFTGVDLEKVFAEQDKKNTRGAA